MPCRAFGRTAYGTVEGCHADIGGQSIPGKVRAEQDLSSEFRLRGTQPPFKEVKDELEILVHTISERVTRMKADDPGAWEAAGDSLARDMAEFVAKRDRPKT